MIIRLSVSDGSFENFPLTSSVVLAKRYTER
jgi:hypothetical protein